MKEIRNGFLFAIGIYLGRDVYNACLTVIDRQLTEHCPEYVKAKGRLKTNSKTS